MKNKKKIAVCAANILLLALIGFCFARLHGDSTVLLSQQAAKYWSGESAMRYAQVSCFFPVNKLSGYDAVVSFRRTIDGKLNDAGVEPREDGRYWTDCYSAQDSLTVTGDRNYTEATVIGVGGNFFQFHPYELLSGGYITDDDIMKDRVVLDYELAWKLFGSASLEGMTVKIGDKPYYIAGVVRRETDKFSEKAFSGEPVIYMDYATLATLKENLGVSTYEIVMPDPITGFAKSVVSENFKEAGGVTVENSARYRFSSIYKIFRNFGSRSVSDSGVVYPYWENAARISEVYVARLYVFILLLSLFPLVCFAALLVSLGRYLTAKLRTVRAEASDAWDDRYARELKWKERRALKRREKILRAHEQKKVSEPEIPEQIPETPPETRGDALESEIIPDIESIVREVLEETETSETK